MIGVIAGFAGMAAVGTLVRAVASDAEHGFNRHMFVTLFINIAGSFLLGLIASRSPNTVTIVGVGGLGSLTTFSTFISQVECIAREGTVPRAIAYAAASVVAGIAAAWLGWSLGR